MPPSELPSFRPPLDSEAFRPGPAAGGCTVLDRTKCCLLKLIDPRLMDAWNIYCQPYLSWSTTLDDFPFVKNACIMIESIANGLRILALESSLIPGFVTWVIEVWMWQLLQWFSGNFVHTGIFKSEIQIDWYPKGWTKISFQTFINLRVSQIWCGWNLRESHLWT